MLLPGCSLIACFIPSLEDTDFMRQYRSSTNLKKDVSHKRTRNRRPGYMIDRLEARQLLSGTISLSTSQVVFNDPIGGAPSSSWNVTVSNTGNANLVIPVCRLTFSGADAGQFAISYALLPMNIAP